MELQRKFLISLSLEKDFFSGTVIYVMYAVQMSGEVVASDAFSTIKNKPFL